MEKRIRKLAGNPSVQFTVMSAAASGINIGTLILFGRIFPVEEYGVISTFQALLANVAVLMMPLQILFCRKIAGNRGGSGEKAPELSALASLLLVMNGAECLILLAAAVPVMRYLHLPGFLDYFLYVLLVCLNNLYLVACGAAQGRQDFRVLGWAGILLYGVKLLFGAGLGLAGTGPLAVIIGFCIAEACALVFLFRRIRRLAAGLRREFRFSVPRETLKTYLRMTVVYAVVSLYMNNGDLLFGNLYVPEKEIGLYSVAITLSKISVFLIATPMATLLLPKAAAAEGRPAEQRKQLRIAEGITIGLSAAFGGMLFLLRDRVTVLLYGADYAGAAGYIGCGTVFSLALGAFWVFYQYAMATELEKPFTVSAIFFGSAAAAGILLLRPGMAEIALFMAASMGLTVCSSVVLKHLFNNYLKKS